MTTLAAMQRERLDRLFPWEMLDREAALAQPDLLDLVREACLIESYFAVYTAKMMQLFWYDVEATSTFSVEAFEAFVHFAALRRYLDEVGYRPVTDDEVRALRARDREAPLEDELTELVNFMATEHFAAYFFRDLKEATREPVLRRILERFGPEETVHAQLAADLIQARIAGRPDLQERVLHLVREFRHVGAYVLPRVSNVNQDNLEALLDLDRKVADLLGRRLSEALNPTTVEEA